MKKIFKYIGIGCIVLIGIFIALSNYGKIYLEKKQKEFGKSLEGMVAEMNCHLPIKDSDNFDFLIMDSVLIEGESVVWIATLDTTFFYPSKESEIFPESMNGGILPVGNRNDTIDIDVILSKELMDANHRGDALYYYLFTRKDNPNPFFEEIMKRKYSQVWRCKSPFSNKSVYFVMTYEEQKKMEDYCTNHPQQALEDFVKEYVERQNSLLTLASNNSDVNIYLTVEDDAFCYHYVFSKVYSGKGYQPISNLRAMGQELYEAVREDVNTLPIFFSADEICRKTNKRLLLRFTDWNKTDSLDIIM